MFKHSYLYDINQIHIGYLKLSNLKPKKFA